MKAYKGFDEDWKCRGFQFEVGKEYEEENAVLCKTGFHACEAPLDTWNYYRPTDGCNYAEVELSRVSKKKEGRDTKRVGKQIAVKAALTIAGLIQAQVAWVFEKAKDADKASGNSSTAASSGSYSTAASSGDSSTAASSGNYSTAASSGNYSTAASSGNSSKAASSGDYSTAASSGNYSMAACDTNGFACVAGIGGCVKGNSGSALSAGYIDADGKHRIAVAYVGEDGIEPDTWYRVDKNGKWVKA